jgi:hypothetical protein
VVVGSDIGESDPGPPPSRRRTFWFDHQSNEPTAKAIATVVLALAGFLLILILLPGAVAGCGAGQACVVRNGGPLDDRNIRKTMQPGSSIQLVGFFSQIRHYRSTDNQSQYRISPDPQEADKKGVDYVQVPTKDGVQVTLKATTFFTTAFTGRENDVLLREFDERFGNREYSGMHVWDGTEGYAAWQDAVFRPLLNNAIRKTILTFDCEDLISSCALVRAGKSAGDILQLTENRDNSQNFDRVGAEIDKRLSENIQNALRSGQTGDTFLKNISFKLEDVELTEGLQRSVNAAQEANVDIAKARAEAETAKQTAAANRQLAASLKQSPELKQVRVAELYSKACIAARNCTLVQGGGALVQTGK